MSLRLLVLSPLAPSLVEALLAAFAGDQVAGAVEVFSFDASADDLPSALAESDIVLGDYTNNIALDAASLDAARPCLLVQQPSAGYQHIDTEHAAVAGIPVANVPGANAVSVAEHTIMVVLACLKKLLVAHEKTRTGEWAQDEMATFGVFELSGKTLGIVGAGTIGREVARRAAPFDCRVVYFDVNRLDPETERDLGVSFLTLEQLAEQSDVVTIHVPLTPSTENLFDEEMLSRMKEGAILVNVSRGPVIDEEALAGALRRGRLSGAAIDVFSSEPPAEHNPLIAAPNTILTPHIAGATNESRMRIIGEAIANVARVVRGEEPINVINENLL